jgi:hypothetical protein
VTALDRLAKGYEPSFDIDYQVGAQGELFVADIIDSLTKGGTRVEVKRDEKVEQTGNVYLELECLKRGAYVPSGIATSKAEFWAFVLPRNVLIVAPTESVRALAARYSNRASECNRGSHPTKGVTIPVGLFVQELHRYIASPKEAT